MSRFSEFGKVGYIAYGVLLGAGAIEIVFILRAASRKRTHEKIKFQEIYGSLGSNALTINSGNGAAGGGVDSERRRSSADHANPSMSPKHTGASTVPVVDILASWGRKMPSVHSSKMKYNHHHISVIVPAPHSRKRTWLWIILLFATITRLGEMMLELEDSCLRWSGIDARKAPTLGSAQGLGESWEDMYDYSYSESDEEPFFDCLIGVARLLPSGLYLMALSLLFVSSRCPCIPLFVQIVNVVVTVVGIPTLLAMALTNRIDVSDIEESIAYAFVAVSALSVVLILQNACCGQKRFSTYPPLYVRQGTSNAIVLFFNLLFCAYVSILYLLPNYVYVELYEDASWAGEVIVVSIEFLTIAICLINDKVHDQSTSGETRQLLPETTGSGEGRKTSGNACWCSFGKVGCKPGGRQEIEAVGLSQSRRERQKRHESRMLASSLHDLRGQDGSVTDSSVREDPSSLPHKKHKRDQTKKQPVFDPQAFLPADITFPLQGDSIISFPSIHAPAGALHSQNDSYSYGSSYPNTYPVAGPARVSKAEMRDALGPNMPSSPTSSHRPMSLRAGPAISLGKNPWAPVRGSRPDESSESERDFETRNRPRRHSSPQFR